MAKEPFKIDRNGTKWFASYECDRCFGKGGSEVWNMTGWTCWKCGGTGKLDKPIIWKEYTPEYEAKLAVQREKRAEKKRQEQVAKAEDLNRAFLERKGFNEQGETFAVLGDTYKIKDTLKDLGCKFDGIIGWHSPKALEGYATVKVMIDDLYGKDAAGVYSNALWDAGAADIVREANEKAEAEKAQMSKSEYVGKAGDKIGTEARLINVAWFDTKFGTTFVYTFEDIWKNVFVWKTSGCCEIVVGGLLKNVEVGQKIILKGTVKDHSEYKGVKQTVLTRCKFEAYA